MEAIVFLALSVPFLILLYLAFLLFIRPSKSVWLASLPGSLLIVLASLLVDIVAHYAHWWHYTFKGLLLQGSVPSYLTSALNTLIGVFSYTPVPFYFSSALLFGSLAYLLIWRFWRTTRWFSLLLLVGVPLFCIWRDLSGGFANSSYQTWDNPLAASIVTVVLWLVTFYAGFWLFWRVAASIAPAKRTAEILSQQNISHVEE